MDMKSQRKVSLVGSEEPLAEIMAKIASALLGNGPALAFGPVQSSFAPDSIAVVVTTTGSTGVAKEVALTAQAVIASAQASHKFLGAKIGQRWSLLLPLTHIAGVNILVRCLELQSQPIDLRNFEGEYPHADYTAIVPTQLYRALHGDKRLLQHLQSAKAVLVGGAHLPRHLRDQAEHHKITIVTTYGMSETSGGCVYNGEPLDGIKIEIDAHSLVRISGKTLASTYLNNESEWQKSFDGTWFTTQDIGEYTDGFLQILGRDDEIIISGGENVSLSAIDELLSLHFPDIQAAAFAVSDAEWGHALHLAIVGEIEDSTLLIFLEKTLGVSAKPKKIHRVDVIPQIGIGKVDRKALVELLHNE